MKLKATLQIGAVFPILLALLVSVALFFRMHTLERIRTENALSEQIFRLIVEAHGALQKLFLRPEKHSRNEWEQRARMLDEVLNEAIRQDPSRRTGWTPLLERHRALRRKLTSVLDAEESRPPDAIPMLAASAELHGLMADAVERFRTSTNRLRAVEQVTDRIFLAFVGMTGLALAGLTLTASRNVVRRLRVLQEALRRVVAGDHTVQLEHVVGDELSETFHAFNEMVARVRCSLDALKQEREEWKGEAEKQRKAAATLRQAHMSLADALTKLRRAQEQIIQQERLRALEQIVNGVARDFAATIAPAVTTMDFLMTMATSGWNPRELKGHLTHIHDAIREAERQLRLLADVFLTPEKRPSEPVDIHRAVRRAIRLVSEAHPTPDGTKTRPAFQFHVKASEVPPVEGNMLEFVEAFANLMENSLDAMPSGGSIEVTSQTQGEKVLVTVTDQGEGMSEEVRLRCLEPFFSTKGPPHSGMGLTYVVAAIGRYGGTIDIRSAPGTGTTVLLTLLPFKGRYSPLPVKGRPIPLKHKLRCLVVDDEEYVRQIFFKGLAIEGHTVVTASNGREGLARATSEEYDVIILDRAMPDMMGEEVAIGIREKRPQIPIVLLTGLGEMMRKEGTIPKCVDLVLSKPITVSGLLHALRELLSPKDGVT